MSFVLLAIFLLNRYLLGSYDYGYVITLWEDISFLSILW